MKIKTTQGFLEAVEGKVRYYKGGFQITSINPSRIKIRKSFDLERELEVYRITISGIPQVKVESSFYSYADINRALDLLKEESLKTPQALALVKRWVYRTFLKQDVL